MLNVWFNIKKKRVWNYGCDYVFYYLNKVIYVE